jgi:NADH-quinone oxidoreductase subunit M
MRAKAERFSFAMALVAESIVLATLSTSLPWVLAVLLTASAILPWLELRRRGTCTRMFALYMSVHSGLLIVGTLLLGVASESHLLSNLAALCLTASLLIRAGVFPAHSWIVDLFERASFGTAILFIAPMIGAYGMMRLVLPVAPQWALHGVAILALVTSVYAAALALVQTEGRRFFSFLFSSHSALVLAGLEIATPIGMTGGLCVWLGSGLALGGLALTLRAVEARMGRISLDRFHGLFEHMPHLGAFFLLSALASIGFPGSLAFIGMELLIEGTVAVYPLVGTMIVLAAVLNGVAVFRAYFRIFTGTRHIATISLAASPAERFTVIALSLLVLGAGLWPAATVRSRYHAAEALFTIREGSGVDVPVRVDPPDQSALDAWLEIEREP